MHELFLNEWTKEIEKTIESLSANLPEGLHLPSLATEEKRSKPFTKWLDQLFKAKKSHPHWQKRGGLESINIDEFRTLICDEIPKWVTIHLSI